MRGILFGFLVATMCLCGGHGALAEGYNDEDSDSECYEDCEDSDSDSDSESDTDSDSSSSSSDSSSESNSESSSDSDSESNSESSSDSNSESSSNSQSSSDNSFRGSNSQRQSQVNRQGGQRATTGSQTINIDTPAPDVAKAAKRMARQAARAPRSVSDSKTGVSPCGDSTGLSVQTGVAGGGMATVSETCRAYRLQQLQKVGKGSFSTVLATITHYVGWLPRTILHVARFGVLN